MYRAESSLVRLKFCDTITFDPLLHFLQQNFLAREVVIYGFFSLLLLLLEAFFFFFSSIKKHHRLNLGKEELLMSTP